MEDLSDLAPLRAIALRNVIVGGDEGYLLRKIFRTYSKNFSTPLHVVESLPLYDVLLNFFENLFEEMEKKDLENERLDVIETDEEILARQKQEDREDAELFEIAKETVAQEKADLSTLKLPGEKSRLMEAVKGMTKDVELINDSLKEIREAPQGIRMIFDETLDDGDLDRDSFGLLDEPKKA